MSPTEGSCRVPGMCTADMPYPAPFRSPPTLEPASVREEVRDLDGERGQGRGGPDRGGRMDRKREARGQGPRWSWGEAADSVRMSEHNPG